MNLEEFAKTCRFYYLRRIEDRPNSKKGFEKIPFACVCISPPREGGILHRGISICNPKDHFVKSIARRRALRNAFLASLPGAVSVNPISRGTHVSPHVADVAYKFPPDLVLFTSHVNADMTSFEACIWDDVWSKICGVTKTETT